MMIDTIAMKLVMAPQHFDVVVTTNQFGDILTDIGAGLVGGLGLAPGLCVGEQQAMAQATHGSAPDIAGRNIANPYAMIMSGQMLLAWLGRKQNEPKATAAAQRIVDAVETVIADGKHLTPRSRRHRQHEPRWATRSRLPCRHDAGKSADEETEGSLHGERGEKSYRDWWRRVLAQRSCRRRCSRRTGRRSRSR